MLSESAQLLQDLLLNPEIAPHVQSGLSRILEQRQDKPAEAASSAAAADGDRMTAEEMQNAAREEAEATYEQIVKDGKETAVLAKHAFTDSRQLMKI